MPTIQQLLPSARQRLRQAGCDSPRLDAEMLLGQAMHHNRTWLYANFKTIVTPSQLKEFDHLLQRRAQREPVAYLVGQREFFGLEFQVNEAVLIPRPETELLVETALQFSKNAKSRLTIVDVGTGSGCIAIALAKHLADATIFAVDISAEAVRLARQNGLRHQVKSAITFLQADLLSPFNQTLDLIVSNPPYISAAELLTVSPEVWHYEPRLALAGGADGLAIIRRLLAQAQTKLKPNGCLLVEIGSTQGQAVYRLAQTYFPHAHIKIKQDLAGLDRLLAVRLF